MLLSVACLVSKILSSIFFTLHQFAYFLLLLDSLEERWKRTSDVYLDCSLIPYTKTCTVPINVYMLRCVTSSCTLKWNDANDQVYRISEVVCVGEAICWDFVDMVLSVKCNFSAFCFLTNSSAQQKNLCQ